MSNPSLSTPGRKYYNYFRKRFSQYGDDVRALWGSTASQEVRFRVLTEIGPLQGARILDVGCGFGGFYLFLQKEGTRVGSYTGVDIVPDMLEVARQRLPVSATLLQADFMKEEIPGSFDWVFASGIFFLPHTRWAEYVVSALRKMYDSARLGVGANFLSAQSRSKDNFSRYAKPGSVLDLALREVTEKAVLRHDYRQNDFTLYLYR